MADYIIGSEMSNAHASDILQDSQRFVETGPDASGQVSLRAVAGNNHLGAVAKAGEEHLHLLAGSILSLVEDDEGFAEGAAAHIGERGDLNDTLGHELLINVVAHQLGESIVQRAEVGVNLVGEISRQEAQPLTGLYSGASQHNAVYLVSPEGKDGHGYSEEGLAAAGGTFGDSHIVVPDDGNIFLLTDGSRPDRLTAVSSHQHITEKTVEGFFFSGLHHLYCIAHLLRREAGAAADEGQKSGDGGDSASDPMSGAGDGQYIAVSNEAAVEAFPQYLQQFVAPAQQFVGLPPVGERNAFLDDRKIVGRKCGKFCFIFFRNIFLQSDSSFRAYFIVPFQGVPGAGPAKPSVL